MYMTLQLQHHRLAGGFAKLLPHVSADAIDLLHKLLVYDPGKFLVPLRKAGVQLLLLGV